MAALPGRFIDWLQQVAGFETADGLAVDDGTGPPVAIVYSRFHELVRSADGVVGVLEKDGAVGFAVEGGIVAGVDEGAGLLFFFRFAPDEGFDVGMLGVEDHHFGGAAGLAAGL